MKKTERSLAPSTMWGYSGNSVALKRDPDLGLPAFTTIKECISGVYKPPQPVVFCYKGLNRLRDQEPTLGAELGRKGSLSPS